MFGGSLKATSQEPQSYSLLNICSLPQRHTSNTYYFFQEARFNISEKLVELLF